MVGHRRVTLMCLVSAVAAQDPPLDPHPRERWGQLCHEGGRCSSAFPGPCSTSPCSKTGRGAGAWSVPACCLQLIVLDKIPRLTVVNSLLLKSS